MFLGAIASLAAKFKYLWLLEHSQDQWVAGTLQ
jgi:hypothetical protein